MNLLVIRAPDKVPICGRARSSIRAALIASAHFASIRGTSGAAIHKVTKRAVLVLLRCGASAIFFFESMLAPMKARIRRGAWMTVRAALTSGAQRAAT